jgi:hypothetical protein
MQVEIFTSRKEDVNRSLDTTKIHDPRAAQKLLADRMSSTFGLNFVVPIIKIDLKCSCNSEERYLNLKRFSEIWHSKEEVKRFLVAVKRS